MIKLSFGSAVGHKTYDFAPQNPRAGSKAPGRDRRTAVKPFSGLIGPSGGPRQASGGGGRAAGRAARAGRRGAARAGGGGVAGGGGHVASGRGSAGQRGKVAG